MCIRNMPSLKGSLLLYKRTATVCCLNISLISCLTLYSSPRWSSQRLESMRRPSTSSCMSPTMGGVQTMPCWRPQGALQGGLIILMRTMSENELSEFVGFISNDPMTAHTTTSDLSSPRPVSPCLWPWTVFAPRLCLTSPSAYLSHFLAFYQLFLQETTMRWVSYNSVCSGEVILWVFVCPLVVFVAWSDRL